MDQNELLAQYKSTLEAMQQQVYILKTRLENAMEPQPQEDAYQAQQKDKQVSECQEEITRLNSEILEEKDTHRKLQVELDCLKHRQTEEAPETQELKQRYQELLQENQDLREHYEALVRGKQEMSLEALKEQNPKLYFLKKKVIQVKSQNKHLKNTLEGIENTRNELRKEYANITNSLSHEDKIKSRIKELESIIPSKEKEIESLKEQLNRSKTKLAKKHDETGKTKVQELIDFCQTLQQERDSELQEQEQLQQELDSIIEEISSKENCPNQLTPAEANQQMRAQLRKLEVEASQKSRLLKEKEREKLQLQLRLQEASKKFQHFLGKEAPTWEKPLQPHEQARSVVSRSSKAFTNRTRNRPKKTENPQVKKGQLIEMLSKAPGHGFSRDWVKALESVGSPNQGIASKLVQLNRGEFLSKSKTQPKLQIK